MMTKLTREEYWQINSNGVASAEKWANEQTDPEILLSYRQHFDMLLNELNEILYDELNVQTCMDGYDYWQYNMVAIKENFEKRREIIDRLLIKDEHGVNWIDYERGAECESWCYVPLDRYEELTGHGMHED